MTVIAGLTTNVGEPAVVIGADKGYTVRREEDCIALLLVSLEKDPLIVPLEMPTSWVIEHLRERNIDTIEFGMQHKIFLSKDRSSMVAQTGTNNKTCANMRKVLLEQKKFLKDSELLEKILRPIAVKGDGYEKSLGIYRREFNLQDRIFQWHIPEIRRIFEVGAVTSKSLEPYDIRAIYDRNFHPDYTEFIYARIMESKEDGKVPTLFEITPTGFVVSTNYSTNGSGGADALRFMRKELGTHPTGGGGESEIKIQVDIPKAVDIITNAIKYSNERHRECRGLEYAILTKDGIEKHFNAERNHYSLDIKTVINERLEKLEKEKRSLESIKENYFAKTKIKK